MAIHCLENCTINHVFRVVSLFVLFLAFHSAAHYGVHCDKMLSLWTARSRKRILSQLSSSLSLTHTYTISSRQYTSDQILPSSDRGRRDNERTREKFEEHTCTNLTYWNKGREARNQPPKNSNLKLFRRNPRDWDPRVVDIAVGKMCLAIPDSSARGSCSLVHKTYFTLFDSLHTTHI